MNATVRKSIILGAIALLIATDVQAANTGLPDIISVDFNGSNLVAPVRRWNIDTLAQKYFTPTGTTGFVDMAREASGRILISRCDCGGSFTGPPALYEVNPATGAVQLVVQVPSGGPQVGTMTGLADGRLLGYDSLSRLVFIDPATLNLTPIATTPPNVSPDSLAQAPSGQVYAWAHGNDGMGMIASRLYTVNVSTGAMSLIGGLTGLPVSANFEDIAFAPDGRLIGITEFNGGQNGVLMANSAYEINLQTGIPAFLANVGSVADSIRGFEFVPEPSAILYGITLLALSFIRIR